MVSARQEPFDENGWLHALTERGLGYTDTSHRLRHAAINLGCLSGVVAAFPLLAAVVRDWPVWIAAPLLGLAYGNLIFSLFTLVVHEASHNQFLVLRSPVWRRRLNDAFGWAVCALFLRDFGRHWRVGHLLHHQRPLEEDDPQNCAKYVLVGKELRAKLLRVWLIPFYEFEAYRLWMRDLGDRCPKPEGERSAPAWLRAAAFALGWAAILAWPLSVAPWTTAFTAVIAFKTATTLNFLKSSMEHGGGYREDDDPRLRTRGLRFLGKSLCFPFCITPYHWEHHLVPGIPWYRLPRFRRAIAREIPAEQRAWIYTPDATLVDRVLRA